MKISSVIAKSILFGMFIAYCVFSLSLALYFKVNHYEIILKSGEIRKCCILNESRSTYELIPIAGSPDTVYVNKDDVRSINFKFY